jgi:hypothetical protein
MNGNATWTSENDELLIDFVKDTEALYNIECKADADPAYLNGGGRIINKYTYLDTFIYI